jgi:hypothetical protein
MKRLDPFQDIGNRVTRCRLSLPHHTVIGNTHTSNAHTAMGPTVAMGLNEALVVPMFSDVFGVADDFAVTGAFACAASSFEASGALAIEAGVSSEDPMMPRLPSSFEARGALAIEAGVSSEDPMMPRLPRGRVEPELGWDETKWCDLCSMWLNGPDQYENHCGQKKHLGFVKKAKTYVGKNCEQSPCPMS